MSGMNYLTDEQVNMVQEVFDFYYQFNGQLRPPSLQISPPKTTDNPQNIRVLLAQGIARSGRGLAYRLGRAQDAHLWSYWRVEVVGDNPVTDSEFKLQLQVGTTNGTEYVYQTVATTDKIAVESTAAEVRDALTAAQSTLGDNQITVSYGNPFWDQQLLPAYESNVDDLIVPAADDVDQRYGTCLGIWLIRIPRFVAGAYNMPYRIQAIEDAEDETFMRGLSAINCVEDHDVPVDSVYVNDVFGMATPNPTRPGVKACATWMPDIGYALTSIGYRDMNVDTASVGEFIDE